MGNQLTTRTLQFSKILNFRKFKVRHKGIFETHWYTSASSQKSFHPKHTYWGIIKCPIFRFGIICSQTEDFEHACSILLNALKTRGYYPIFLRSIKTKNLAAIAVVANQTFGCTCSDHSCKHICPLA